jgi:uncharacterized membrane protein YedE/YeeE
MNRLLFCIALLMPSAALGATDSALDPLTYDGGAWSPYVVGAGIGVLSWLTFYFADRAIGASSFYAAVAGGIGKAVAPKHTMSLEYYRKHPPHLDWSVVFVLCTILGGFIAAWTGGEFRNEWLHPMWVARFGDSIPLRAAVAIGGGILMAFGARLAGGCTSGHGISGTMQLNVGSWAAFLSFFAGGVATAFALFHL